MKYGGIHMNIYDFSLTKRNGEKFSLDNYKGKVMLIVNTATGCGFTPQYAPIEEMYEEFHEQGFEVVDVPCNQFGNQTPGSDDEVHEFCTLNYKTKFEQFKKSDVNGIDQLPLFMYLKTQKGFEGFGEGDFAAKMDAMLRAGNPNYDKNPDIKWNFTKFVVDRSGNVVARFEPTADMNLVRECVKSLL